MKQIKRALAHWNITDFTVAERYRENTERIMCRIETEDFTYFLKGIPGEKDKTTIRGNVLAHEYLGNQRSGQHIATNLVLLGTRALKDMGMREGYLSYTYSGPDRLYGTVGYRIKVFYTTAEKKLVSKSG